MGHANGEAWTFGHALTALKRGFLLQREGWHGKGMFIYLVNGSTFEVSRDLPRRIFGADTAISYQAHIDIMTAEGSCVPWVASQADLLAEDWRIVK